MRRLKVFWSIHVRYRVARWLIHIGLFVWPPGRAKAEIMEMLWAWRHEIDATLEGRRAALGE